MSDAKVVALSPECTKRIFAFKRAFQESRVFPLVDFFFALMALGVIFANDTAKAIMNKESPSGSIMITSVSAFLNALTILDTICPCDFIVVEASCVWLTIYWCNELHTFVASIPHMKSRNVIDFSARNIVFVINAPIFLTNDMPTILQWWDILHVLVEHQFILRMSTTYNGLQFATSSTRCYSCNNTRLLCCMLSTYGQPNKKESFCAECIHTALSTWNPFYDEIFYAIMNLNPNMVELLSLTVQA